MTDTDTQPAVDAVDATATPVADTNNAQNTGDDLDTLLAQYEQQTKTPVSPPQTPQQPATVDPDRLRRVEERLFNEDVNKTVANITGGLKVSPRFARGWLDQIAKEKPEVANAFLQKESNPQRWTQIEQSLAKEFAKEVKSVTFDENVTEDRSAVAAAVRGASTKAPAEPAPNYTTMTNGELRDEMRKLGLTSTF